MGILTFPTSPVFAAKLEIVAGLAVLSWVRTPRGVLEMTSFQELAAYMPCGDPVTVLFSVVLSHRVPTLRSE